MACSRMPKCRMRPYGDWLPPKGESALTTVPVGRNDGAPSMVVLLLSARSADAADELGQLRRDRLDHLAAGLAGRDVLAGRELRQGEALRQLARERDGRAGRPARAAAVRHPAYSTSQAARRAAPRSLTGAGVREDVVGDLEALRRVEAEQLLGGRDLVGAERGAVRLERVAQVRGRPADDGVQPDERRPVGHRPGAVERCRETRDVDVDAPSASRSTESRVPAVGGVAREGVLAERDRGVVLDRDLVVVPDHDEVVELLGAGQRRGLGGDALLEVAVGGDHVDRVVERARAGRGVGVEQAALVAGAHGHADRGRQALAERPGRGLDAPGVMTLRVARRSGSPRCGTTARSPSSSP